MSCKGMLYLTCYCLLTSRSFQSVKHQASVSMGRKAEGAIVLQLFFTSQLMNILFSFKSWVSTYDLLKFEEGECSLHSVAKARIPKTRPLHLLLMVN